MAHMWFGDLVTMRGWEDLWLNESFAELMEKLALDAIMPGANVWAGFANDRKAWGLETDQLPSSHPVAPDPMPVSRIEDNFDGITYAKGSATLKQLSAYVGKDNFIAGVRDYLTAHQWGNASLKDLLGAIQQHAPGKDLDQWSQLWLRTRGMAKLRSDSTVGNDGRYTSFSVVQEFGSGDNVVRPQTLRVGLYSRDAKGHLVRTNQVQVEMKAGQAVVEVPSLIGEKAPDLVIVNDDDLTYAKVRLDGRSSQTMLDSLGTVEDPLARAVLWGVAWDMTRDAELTAGDFVGTVIRNAGAETQMTVLTALLQKASMAISLYADPADQKSLHAQLAATAKQNMVDAEPGSDRQLMWARNYITNSGPKEQQFFTNLLDGSAAIPGLTVDTNLRWAIVTHLATEAETAAQTATAQKAIAAQEKADGTDVGRRKALAARAGLPTVAAKEEAWRVITQDQSLSMQARLAVIAGFVGSGDPKLLGRFTSRYESYIPTLWADSASTDEARRVTNALYPRRIVDERMVKMDDRLLASGIPEIAKRQVRDLRDQTQRAMRARQHSVGVASPSGRDGMAA